MSYDMNLLNSFEQAFTTHVHGLADNGVFTQHKAELAVLASYASKLAPVSIEDAEAGHFLVRPELSGPDAVAAKTGLFPAVVKSSNIWLAMHRFIAVSGDTIELMSYDYSSEVTRRKTLAERGLALCPDGRLTGWLQAWASEAEASGGLASRPAETYRFRPCAWPARP
jgi:hypothetical protein